MSEHYYGYGAPYGFPGGSVQPGPQPGPQGSSPYSGNHYAQHYGPYYGQQHGPQYGQPRTAPASGLASWYNFRHPDYLKGLLLGAGAALLLTNPSAQKALIGGAVRVWAAVQGGIEEIKEQIEDVKAELSRED